MDRIKEDFTLGEHVSCILDLESYTHGSPGTRWDPPEGDEANFTVFERIYSEDGNDPNFVLKDITEDLTDSEVEKCMEIIREHIEQECGDWMIDQAEMDRDNER